MTTKYVYSFGGGKADGNGKMKDVLGGKGAGLAEMTNAGLAGASGLHDPDRSLPRVHAQRRVSKEVDQPDGSGPRSSWKNCRGRSSARATIRCWSACARARSSPCPA